MNARQHELAGLHHDSDHTRCGAFGVHFPFRHERAAIGTDTLANTVRAGDPAGTLNNQEQLIEPSGVRADHAARRNVQRVDMGLTMSMGQLDTGCTGAGKQLNGLSSFGAEIDNPYGHEQHF